MFKIVIFVIIFVVLASNTTFAGIQEGGGGSSGSDGVINTPSVSQSSGGGGGSRQIDIDRLVKAVSDGKKNKPQKYEQLKKLLYVEPFPTKDYDENITLGLTVISNKNVARNVTRNDKIAVWTTIGNPNPIEMRKVMYIDLLVLEPNDKSFRKVNSAPIMIMNNEYENKDGKNISIRTFPELSSFNHLKTVGSVILRAHVSDGKNSWISRNYTLDIINRHPVLENRSIEAPERPRFNDPITYYANVTDLDEDPVNITLHILDAKRMEIKNETQITFPGKTVSFLANQYGFFNKGDSGKNFSYYYTFSDGIVVNNTSIQYGPNLTKSVSIWVGKPVIVPDDENQYWWQAYNFSLEMKNQYPGEAPVTVSLFTDTKSHPWKKAADSKIVTLNQESKIVYFKAKPFDVTDANQTFSIIFKYSETDQNKQDYTEIIWSKPVNAKLVKYDFISGLGLSNLFILLMMALLISIFIERRFYR